MKDKLQFWLQKGKVWIENKNGTRWWSEFVDTRWLPVLKTCFANFFQPITYKVWVKKEPEIKMITSWVNYFHQVPWGLEKNWEFLTRGKALNAGPFLTQTLAGISVSGTKVPSGDISFETLFCTSQGNNRKTLKFYFIISNRHARSTRLSFKQCLCTFIKGSLKCVVFLSLLKTLKGCVTKNCGTTSTHGKLKLQKLRNSTVKCRAMHNERFNFHLIWFINDSNTFQIFETRPLSQWAF